MIIPRLMNRVIQGKKKSGNGNYNGIYIYHTCLYLHHYFYEISNWLEDNFMSFSPVQWSSTNRGHSLASY